jgi:hypothetical protein
MFVTKLDLFSIGTIKVPTHTNSISKPLHITYMQNWFQNNLLNWFVF